MRFNSIVATFLLFFTPITNALPVSSIQSQGLPCISIGDTFIRRHGFRVVRIIEHPQPGQQTDDVHLIVEVFEKGLSTWEKTYRHEDKKWSNTGRVKYRGRDGSQDIAFIVLEHSVPKESDTFSLDPAIIRSLARQKKHYHFDQEQWKELKDYAVSNPHEFYWEKHNGWMATPIFNLKNMLDDAKSAAAVHVHQTPNHNRHDMKSEQQAMAHMSDLEAAEILVQICHERRDNAVHVRV
ncbi:hypothetical protein APHAL10511_005510 [Amanita phalloides]|nr:hypothetical protein APHAL10511_005510 [Amanita phalloides]